MDAYAISPNNCALIGEYCAVVYVRLHYIHLGRQWKTTDYEMGLLLKLSYWDYIKNAIWKKYGFSQTKPHFSIDKDDVLLS